MQQENAVGIRSLCAKHIFRDTDKEGSPCHLFVENNGYISPAEKHGSVLHASSSSDGVELWIYDVRG